MNSEKTLAVCCCVMLFVAEPAFTGGTIGRTVGVTCNACHGPDGKSEGAIPSLDGLTAKQIESELLAFRSGKRSATIMNRIARGYTDNEIAAVAEYFANLK
jgi:sulfide dehydrogenase cytochrome subunit